MSAPRDPESVALEVDYWKALLADLRVLNDLLLETAGAVAATPLEVLAILLGSDAQEAGERHAAAVKTALASLGRMQSPLDRIIELAGGRIAVLRREGGLES